MKAKAYGIDVKRGVVNRGNLYRISRAMQRAMEGRPITVGFLGGSITQGCLSSTLETCYAYLVYRWWRERFPGSEVTYLNAGIGGTSSQFGVARVEEDLLSHNPDVVIVEFSVNDEDNAHFLETYEGLIRKICGSKTRPGVLIVNSVKYDDGVNAQARHVEVGRAYQIPCVSMKPTLYERMREGAFTSRRITEDDLHPNDLGHSLMAEVITDFLEEIRRDVAADNTVFEEADIDIGRIPPLSENAYENSLRFRNGNCREILRENKGFTPDQRPQKDIREIFRHGWTAEEKGARMVFEVEGTCIGLQYRKSVEGPAPVARAVIDGRQESAVILDGNFEQTWGDCLYLETLAEHLPYGKHTVEIELIKAAEGNKVPFYLVSLIASGAAQGLREIPVGEIPELKVHGRTTPCREPLILFWTASGFECNLSGTELSVLVEVTYDTFEPWFSYTVNGDWVGRQMLTRGKYWVPLFRGMSGDKIKNVRFFKDLQAMSDDGASYIRIHALRCDGRFYPVKEKSMKLEFIGDSITSGEGLFGAKQEEDWIPMFFSALKSYAYLTARKLDAEYRVFSQSGWGICSGWDNNVNNAIPRHYRQICSLMPGSRNESYGGSQPHDFGTWQPDFVIVNLGTNDASAFEQPAWVDGETGTSHKMHKNPDGSYNKEDIGKLQKAVRDFLYTLRECNPGAGIIWCYGMLGAPLQLEICEAISQYAAETDDHRVSYLQLPAANDRTIGAREHPGFLCHRQTAEILAQYIEQLRDGK